jgi:hypothetical protein
VDLSTERHLFSKKFICFLGYFSHGLQSSWLLTVGPAKKAKKKEEPKKDEKKEEPWKGFCPSMVTYHYIPHLEEYPNSCVIS